LAAFFFFAIRKSPPFLCNRTARRRVDYRRFLAFFVAFFRFALFFAAFFFAMVSVHPLPAPRRGG